MNSKYILIAIAIASICTFSLRLFPFLIAGDGKHGSDKLAFLGRILPPAIMAILLVYCLKDVPTNMYASGIPKIVGVLVTGASYIWRKNTFLSILLGTAAYMILLQIV